MLRNKYCIDHCYCHMKLLDLWPNSLNCIVAVNMIKLIWLFVDNRAGGICHNEDEPCTKEKHATCIDGCCICNSGYSVVGGSCTEGIVMSRNVRKRVLTCAPNDDSNQPTHPRSLIRNFAVRMKKHCVLGYPKCGQQMRRLFWSSLGAEARRLFSDVAALIDHFKHYITQ